MLMFGVSQAESLLFSPLQMSYSESDPAKNQTIADGIILVGFSFLHEKQIILFLVLLVLYLVILLGNLFVILLIKLNPSLQIPMYFFLVNLSFLDIGYITSVIPQLLVHLLEEQKTISLVGCAVQMFFLSTMDLAESCLLTAMAYDRYVAIHSPLQYTTIMSSRTCLLLAGASWFTGISVQIIQTTWIFSLPFCGSHRIHHFFCDIPVVLDMACADTSKNDIMLLIMVFITCPFLLILLSYICIITTILRLPSAEGRRKAFSTCSSHLMVVTFYYGAGYFGSLVPKSTSTLERDLMISLVNTIVIPVSHLLIYTLRNKEVKGAFVKTVEKSIFAHNWRNQRMRTRVR
nr:olfactory receptor 10A4-like [Pelodiscus sinensis]|eukprot:XP_025045104.1 olfactory receptor 10A4-like [Pelodiscus sinensis]